jgi:hypothetical protein
MDKLPTDVVLFGRQNAGGWELRFVRGAAVFATGSGKTLRDAFVALSQDWKGANAHR